MRHLDQIKLVVLWNFLCEWQFLLVVLVVLRCVVWPRFMRPSSSFPPQYRHRQREKRLGGQTLAQTSLRVLFTSSAPHSSSTFAFQPLHSSILILKVDSAFRRRAVPHPDISSAWRLSSCPASPYRRSAPAPAAFFLNADPKPEGT